MKFRKKPVVVDAIQHTGEWSRIPEWLMSLRGDGFAFPLFGVPPITRNRDRSLNIKTLEGVMRCEVGDWIIRGVKGELYPCKPDIFEATYEAVEE